MPTPDHYQQPTSLSQARSARDASELAAENERLVAALGEAERARMQAEARADMLAGLLANERKKLLSAETMAYQAIERADELAGLQRALNDAGPVERRRLLREARKQS
jgi:hypothetical protein